MRLEDDGSLIASLILDARVLCRSVWIHRLPAGSSAQGCCSRQEAVHRKLSLQPGNDQPQQTIGAFTCWTTDHPVLPLCLTPLLPTIFFSSQQNHLALIKPCHWGVMFLIMPFIPHHVDGFRCECCTVPSVSSLHISFAVFLDELLNKHLAH